MRTENQSSLVTVFALLVATIAIVGTQFLGWEWGSSQTVPTVIGIAVAGVAAVLFLYRRVN